MSNDVCTHRGANAVVLDDDTFQCIECGHTWGTREEILRWST